MTVELARHLGLFLDVADEAMLLLRPDGRVVGASEAAARLLEMDPDDLQGRQLRDLITSPPDAAALFLVRSAGAREAILGAITLRNAAGEDIHCSAYWRRVQLAADGESAIVSLRLRAQAEPNAFGSQQLNPFERLGDRLAVAISAEEARRRLAPVGAARRQAEEAMRRERDFSDAVIKSLPGVFYICDQQDRFLRWNDNFERVLGRTSSEISAMGPTDFFNGEDKARVRSAINEVFLHGNAAVEADLISKDGRETSYYFTGVADTIGDSRCLLGVGVDLTERRKAQAGGRESEASYRTLFDYAPAGILIADSEGRYLDANPSICRMLGYDLDDLIGRDATDIVDEAERKHIAPALHAIKTTALYHEEWVFRRRDGSTFPGEVVATIMPHGAVMAMVRDITERQEADVQRREAESAMRDMQSQLARFGRLSMLGEFASTIAHEVSQPLAAIMANCDASLRWLAADPPNLDRAREAMSRIIRDSNRAHEVIKHTRAFALRGEPDFSDIDLNDVIQDIVLMTGEEQQKSHVVIVEDLSSDLPMVRGDCIELQQVVLNLFLNSIEAMRVISERERVLTVRTDIDSPGLVRVSVQDTGAGFDPDTAERLFEHLFTTKPGGTGLGLRISRSIVEAHGGRLWATRLAPHGALFQFTVPVAADEAAKDAQHD